MMAQMNIKIEKDLKDKVENVLYQLGISTTEAVRMFFNKVISEKGIPFDLKIKDELLWDNLNDTTKQAIISNEVGEVVKDVKDIWN